MFQVSVADDVLSAQPNRVEEFPGVFSGWHGPLLFLISPHSSSDVDNLTQRAEAARAAVERFWLVTSRGVELPGRWADADGDLPDSVVHPCLLDDGVVIGVAPIDGVVPAQADTMLRIVLGELHSRRVSAHVSCPPSGVDDRSLPPWAAGDESPTDANPRTREDSQQVWYVFRAVHCTTTTGVPYLDREWFRPDGTWSRDMTGALTFENISDSMREVGEFVRRLRVETGADRDPRIAQLNGVLLSAGQDVPLPVPPDSVRDHGHVWRAPV